MTGELAEEQIEKDIKAISRRRDRRKRKKRPKKKGEQYNG